jgi:hypothetical protein
MAARASSGHVIALLYPLREWHDFTGQNDALPLSGKANAEPRDWETEK